MLKLSSYAHLPSERMSSKNELMRSSHSCALNELMCRIARGGEERCGERCGGRCGKVYCGVGEVRGGVGVKGRVEIGMGKCVGGGEGRCGQCRR